MDEKKWFRVEAAKRRVMTIAVTAYVQATSEDAAMEAVLAGDYDSGYASEEAERDMDEDEPIEVLSVVEDDDAMCGPCADCGKWCHLTDGIGGCDCAEHEDNDDTLEQRMERRMARGEDV